MAEHAKLGVRLNRMGCVDGRKILENPYTSDNNPRYWKKTLCDLCASQVALDLFHGPVIFCWTTCFVFEESKQEDKVANRSATAVRIPGFDR